MALKRDIAVLSTVPLFEALDEDALRLIAFSAENRVYRAGDMLFRRGEMSDGGYVVLSGAIALDAADDGSPAPVVASAGMLIGELALIVDTVRPATAIVREPCAVLKISRHVFRRVLEEFPELAERVHAHCEAKLRSMTDELSAIRRQLILLDDSSPVTARG
ncbi:MAG: cyclic nucleotide-binding domain-containing protein [Alsobacter sp.]